MRPVFASLARATALVLVIGAVPAEVRAQGTSSSSGSTATITRGGPPPDTTTTSTTSTRTASTPPRTQREPAEPTLPVNEEDDGRKADFLWLEVEGGVSYVNLVAFEQQNFSGAGTTVTGPGFEEIEGVGPMVGVGLGFRIFFLALGARATFASYPGFEIGTIGGEVQLRLPTPIIEPWIRLGAGYAWQGSASYEAPIASATTTSGWTVNAALGFDWFVTWWFTIGLGVSLDVLNMTRQVDVTQPCMGLDEFCPTENGDAIGAQARGFLQLGLHF